MKPNICILKADGTNCDVETAYAFQKAGGNPITLTMHELLADKKKLHNFQILVLPGGFSYGDDIAGGKILAIELLAFLHDELLKFIHAGKLIIGICNGFQVLVRTGLLPYKTGTLGYMQATLLTNESGIFHCRWVNLKINNTNCVFTKSLQGREIMLPVAHAEGNFFADNRILAELESERCVPVQYKDNFNGSCNAIAGVCDPSGRIFGLMPHPERFVERYHHPQWRSAQCEPFGQSFFKDGVDFFE